MALIIRTFDKAVEHYLNTCETESEIQMLMHRDYLLFLLKDLPKGMTVNKMEKLITRQWKKRHPNGVNKGASKPKIVV